MYAESNGPLAYDEYVTLLTMDVHRACPRVVPIMLFSPLSEED